MRAPFARLCLAAAGLLAWSWPASGTAEARPRRPHPYDGYARVEVAVAPYGLYFGAGLVGIHILAQSRGDDLLESGSGLTAFGGWRISQSLALELGWVATFHRPAGAPTDFGGDADHLVLNGFTADGKIYLGGERELVEPYVQGGLGLYFLDNQVLGAQSVGSGFQAGGGFDIHIGSRLDVGVRALFRGVAMGPPRSDENDTFVSALAGEANLTLRF